MKKMFLSIALVTILFLGIGNANATETSTANNLNTPTLSKQTSADIKNHTHTVDIPKQTIEDNTDNFTTKAGIDAPNLIRLSSNWTVGAQLEKQLNSTNIEEGWGMLIKATYSGSFIDFSNKK